MLTNVRERNKIQTVKDIKAVKRRVGEEIRRRESRQVGRDMEGFFEHGLGALHRLRIRTGYLADADRLQREYPLSYLTIDGRLFIRSCRGLISFAGAILAWGKNDCHQRKVDRERQRTAENDRPDEKVTREGGEK